MVILQEKVPGISPQSLSRFVLRARKAVGLQGTVNVLLTGNSAMRSLNVRFRSKDKATDVLSFPSKSSMSASRGFAGEIAICAAIATKNAARLGHSAALEIKILTLHGVLHLAGYDHERDNGKMARKEESLRRVFRLPSSLIERGQSGKRKAVTPRSGIRASRRPQRTA